jgi:hypothetical protein
MALRADMVAVATWVNTAHKTLEEVAEEVERYVLPLSGHFHHRVLYTDIHGSARMLITMPKPYGPSRSDNYSAQKKASPARMTLSRLTART